MEAKMESQKLIDLAKQAMNKAYAPYSHFKVGAALLTDANHVYTGCNIENASFGATNCAERTAVFKAISEGERHIVKIAVVSDAQKAAWPCGICCQVLSEFMDSDGIVILEVHNKIQEFRLCDLLPYSFSAKDMNSN